MSPFAFFPPGPDVHRDRWRSPVPASSAGVALDLAGVGRRFADIPVLQGIDLAIAPGQFVAVVGRSGCGKSTLLRLIAGLDQPSAGAVHADGQALVGVGAETRLMFQNARLLPWKRVLDNVGLGLSGHWQARAREALAEVGLADKAEAWPAQLSGGQQQRVALARALIHQPRVLLLDEPLGALDALTRLEMQALIERLWQQHGFTVVLVTHDVAEAVKLADRVVVLEAGGVGLDVAVDLARPRAHRSHAVAAIEARVLDQVLGHSAAKYAPADTQEPAAVGSATVDSPLAPVPPAPVTDRSLRPVARVAGQRRRHCELA